LFLWRQLPSVGSPEFFATEFLSRIAVKDLPRELSVDGPKLDGEEIYIVWSLRMTSNLKKRKCWKAVEKSLVIRTKLADYISDLPAAANEEEQEAQQELHQQSSGVNFRV
jgi:hypothetical protein